MTSRRPFDRPPIHLTALLAVALLAPVSLRAATPELHADHVTAFVEDVDRAVQWYHQVLGFEPTQHGGAPDGSIAYATVHGGGLDLVLLHINGASAPAPHDGPLTRGWIHVVWSVGDLPAMAAHLRDQGIVYTPRIQGNGLPSLVFNDSEGNELEIITTAP